MQDRPNQSTRIQGINGFRRQSKLRHHCSHRSKAAMQRALTETLEQRTLLSITVTTGSDVIDPSDGVTSLREAILAADANPGSTIDFADAYQIQLTSPLPALSGAASVIDGTATPGVVLDGSQLAALGYANADGIVVSGNASVVKGIAIRSFNNGIVITAAGVAVENDEISGNQNDGIRFNAGGSGTAQGNSIGITQTLGVAHPAPNGGNGVSVYGGPVSILYNVISASGGDGVYLENTSGNNIDGNTIGADPSGTLDYDTDWNFFGNCGSGVNIVGASSDNTVGGPVGNLISNNNASGVSIDILDGMAGNLVRGNRIGIDANGERMGNQCDGVRVAGSGVQITANVISGNFSNGVTIVSGTGNAILGNSIYSNSRIGIDLGDDFVTENDSAGHDGPNLYQNFPVISSAVFTPGTVPAASTLTIDGTLSAAPDATYVIELFANQKANDVGYGEGQTCLGSISVTTNGFGVAAISKTFTGTAAGQLAVSATATDALGNTSEFSLALKASVSTKRNPAVTWSTPADIVYGTALSAAQLNATADVAGSFIYSLPTGAILSAGAGQTISVSFVPDNPAAYNPVTASVSINVLKATLTISADSFTRVYGDANPTLTGTITGLAGGEIVAASYTTSAVPGSPVGTYPIVAAVANPSSPTLSNYNLVLVDGTLSVSARPITVTADSQTKRAGTSDPQLTYKIGGSMVQGESLTGCLTRQPGECAGSYAILQGTLAASRNYKLSFVSSNLTITAAPVSVLSISGRVLRDLTGNGFSRDDVGLGGVTVKLFLESDHNLFRDCRDRLIMMATSDANGAYCFTNLTPGRYYVKEVRPQGYVRTAPTSARYYSVNLGSSSVSGLDFDNFKKCVGKLKSALREICQRGR